MVSTQTMYVMANAIMNDSVGQIWGHQNNIIESKIGYDVTPSSILEAAYWGSPKVLAALVTLESTYQNNQNIFEQAFRDVKEDFFLGGSDTIWEWVGQDALEEASSRGHWECVRLLLQHGATVGMAVHFAAGNNQKKVLEVFQQYFNRNNINGLDRQDSEGLTPVCWAVRKGHSESAEYLLKNGANICWYNNFGMNLMTLARCTRDRATNVIVEQFMYVNPYNTSDHK